MSIPNDNKMFTDWLSNNRRITAGCCSKLSCAHWYSNCSKSYIFRQIEIPRNFLPEKLKISFTVFGNQRLQTLINYNGVTRDQLHLGPKILESRNEIVTEPWNDIPVIDERGKEQWILGDLSALSRNSKKIRRNCGRNRMTRSFRDDFGVRIESVTRELEIWWE